MTKTPAHLFEAEGHLFDTRRDDWSKSAPLRPHYRETFETIATVSQFKATLRAGGYAWPGGYPLYFVCSDGGALSFDAARQEFKQIIEAIGQGGRRNDWAVVGCTINWEDTHLHCEHTGKPIPSAHGDD